LEEQEKPETGKVQSPEAVDPYGTQVVYQNRRYVGTKETAAYILNNISNTFNINMYGSRFIYDVLKIDFRFLAILGTVGGIWDVINDVIIGVIIDRTRTRYGKFRPYLLTLEAPLILLGSVGWLLPVFFPNTPADYVPKFVVYFIFNIIGETAGTFTNISSTGLLSTITPHPIDRTRLITMAQFYSGFVEKGPQTIMGVLIDLIDYNVFKIQLKSLYIFMGLLTQFISASMSVFFFIVSKERVMQSIEQPSIKQGLRSILNNKPMLIIVLSQFLSGFSVGTSRINYYIDVLGTASINTIVGIPGALVSPTSYAFVPWARKRFSTKAIWIAGDIYCDILWISVLGIGSINGTYLKKWRMIPILMIEETLEMLSWGIGSVIPNEIYNEAMDYCEWKNGYRTEAMTGVAKGLITKIQNVIMNVFNNIVMQKIGYVQGMKIGTQATNTKFWLFVLSTGLPTITRMLGVVPKFYYNLSAEKREKMYEELFERRKAMTAAMAGADEQEMARLGKAQMNGEFLSDTKL